MNRNRAIFSGIFGILGGLVLFLGDMLFYYDSESTDLLKNMSLASDERITLSGISALLAAWLYCLGLGQINYAFKYTKKTIKHLILICFGFIFIAYGVIHGAYVAIATASKIAAQNNLDLYQITALASDINNNLRMMVYPVFGLLSIFFIKEVLKKNTIYSNWILIFYPLIPFLIQPIINDALEGKFWVVIMGGYLNILLIIFFTASTISVWKNH